MTAATAWHRVLDTDGLPEGRVMTVTAGHHTLALTHVEGKPAGGYDDGVAAFPVEVMSDARLI
jgi:hypothetical protein